MKNILLLLSTIAIISSCSLKKICNDRFPPEKFDSISIVVRDSIVRDTLFIPYQDVVFDTISPCPPHVVYHKEINKGGLTGIVDISYGKIRFTCKQDSLQKEINKLMRRMFITKSKREIIRNEIKYVPWYYKMLAWSNLLWLLIIVIILFLNKFIKV